MRVAFFVYPWAMQSPGGGEIFLLKTKEALEKQGVQVKLFNQWEDKLKDFDILHVFGSVKDCLGLMETAKNLHVKTALSPIFWSTFNRSLHEYGSFSTKTKMILRHSVKRFFPIMPSARRKMLTIADALLPNSFSEAEQVEHLFAIKKEKMYVVPLGVDEKFHQAEATEFIHKYQLKDFILSVGRIEPRKNQLSLILALKGSGKKIVFIGNPVTGYEAYYQLCRQSAENTLFIDRLEHSSSLLASAYAACSVFVLQGWFETPGLVALEAGLAGAKLAVTRDGSTREYFKDYAEYFNPANLLSIKTAIEKASAKPKNNQLPDYIMKNFLWLNCANATIEVYRKLLS